MPKVETKKTRTPVTLPDTFTNEEGEYITISGLDIMELVNAQTHIKKSISVIEETRAHAAELSKKLPNLDLELRAINQQIRHLTK